MSVVISKKVQKSWQNVRESYRRVVSRDPSLTPLAWSSLVTSEMAVRWLPEHAALEQLQRRMKALSLLTIRFVKPGANLTGLRAEFAEPTADGATTPKVIELKGNGKGAKEKRKFIKNTSTDKKHPEWTDELEGERIILIEKEEERELTPNEAARLGHLMTLSKQRPRHRDPEGLRRHLAGMAEFSEKVAELERRAAAIAEEKSRDE